MKPPQSSDLFGVLAALESPDECRSFLAEVLSPDELRDVMTRWEILLLLAQGLTYQDIKTRLNTSNETISRGSRTLTPESLCRRIIETYRLELP